MALRPHHYKNRSMMARRPGPREDDIGFAKHLASQLRVAVLSVGDQYVVEKRGQVVFEAATVRGIVSYLQKEITARQLHDALITGGC